MRLDQLMNKKGLTSSRSRAYELIKKGFVKVNQKICKKPAKEVKEDEDITILSNDAWVGRGARKLSFALNFFNIQIKGKTALDVGSSTGGFTQVLLKKGASEITAVDVGSNQLDSGLRRSPKIISMEKTDIRSLKKDFDLYFDLVVVDVSFISISKVIDHIDRVTKSPGEIVILFKPQFEVGKENLTKNGIVRDRQISVDTLSNFISGLDQTCLEYQSTVDSEVKGKNGNQEIFIYLKK